MKKHKLSDWQSGDTIPELDGVYQRKNQFGIFYALFQAGLWMVACTSPIKAEKETLVTLWQGFEWRGIL